MLLEVPTVKPVSAVLDPIALLKVKLEDELTVKAAAPLTAPPNETAPEFEVNVVSFTILRAPYVWVPDEVIAPATLIAD